MTSLEIWLIAGIIFTIIIAAFLLWYVRKLLGKLLFISENINDLVVMVQNYQEHLERVYNMESYVGDPAIEYLIKHTNSLIDMLEDYQDVYSIVEPLEILKETEEDDDPPQENEEETISIQPSQENVFYAGTRRRDS